MTDNQYLANVLKEQTLLPGSLELVALKESREAIDSLLLDAFPGCNPTIRYGGSHAKGTMIKDDYDLDIICYFPHDQEGAGSTLEDIYNNVRNALTKKYTVQEKTSALRLLGHEADIHIDVVPGRFTDGSKTDAFLFQRNGEKSRLKTNTQVHIDHIAKSEVRDTIRLVKLWRYLNAVQARTFPLELMVIDLLANRKGYSLESQLEYVFTKFRDNMNGIRVEDPANPAGNDLSGLVDTTTRNSLSMNSQATLEAVETRGWEYVFGPAEQSGNSYADEVILTETAMSASSMTSSKAPHIITSNKSSGDSFSPPRPWCNYAGYGR